MATTRYFVDLALRANEELSEGVAKSRDVYAVAMFDNSGGVESAAMIADGEIDQVRWFAAAPSDELHTRHLARYGARRYTVCRGEALAGGSGLRRTIWAVLEDGRVWSRDVLCFASATDDTIVETWRYDDAGRLCHHYVYDRGRLVRGEEYMPDGTLHRSIDNDLRGEE